jgi:hypothetical protein
MVHVSGSKFIFMVWMKSKKASNADSGINRINSITKKAMVNQTIIPFPM